MNTQDVGVLVFFIKGFGENTRRRRVSVVFEPDSVNTQDVAVLVFFIKGFGENTRRRCVSVVLNGIRWTHKTLVC